LTQYSSPSESSRKMVRRIASQVHQQVTRLMKADFIQEPPPWYQAVLQHPPLPLPPRQPAPRTEFDTKLVKNRKKHTVKAKLLPIYYVEDDIRRQFFRDHPFEAFRPRTLAEEGRIRDGHSITGAEWTRLRQRGRNPTSEE
jgi:small subunit ribosomal protein S23